MHRIDHPTKSADENGTGKDGFTEGDPGLVAPTVVTDDWLNGVQEELAGTIEAAGVVLAKGSQDQLADAISRFFQMMAVSNWESRDTGATQDVEAFAYDPSTGRLVAVLDSEEIRYSDDLGASWTDAGLSGANKLRDVAYSADLGQFCAVGDGGVVYTSTDGVSWTSRTSGTSESLRGVRWSSAAGHWCAVGSNNTAITSPDGIAWTSRTLGTASDDYRGVAVSDTGRFVVLGTDGTDTRAWYSDTETGWTQVTVAAGAPISVLGNLTYDPAAQRFVASIEFDIYASSDGTSWSKVADNPLVFRVRTLVPGGGLLLGTASGKVWSSVDGGTTWTERAFLPVAANRGLHASGLYFVGGGSGAFARSLRGI